MLYGEERQQKIVSYVEENGRASVLELCQKFEVSESTIRRDLKELEEMKMLRRQHGGAIAKESVTFEPTFSEKSIRFLSEKKAIAKYAVQFIQEGDSILIDSGTTTKPLVDEIKKLSQLTVVTNSVVFAKELENYPNLEVIVPGGKLRTETLALVGPLTELCLSNLHFDKAFIATNGLDLNEGLTTPNLTEAATKRKMIEQSKQVIVMTDHSKFQRISFAKFGMIDQIDHCITTEGAPTDILVELQKRGVEVHTVTAQEDD
ncbi:DeoR/GlpR family DNA-binding transcription regulator [Aquibacillus sp. 3ASR75-11]|uniref:DeoR/GlpR family DNA-binding transcription regulator n=1 Tax=Terrihalobacillus insolitus TaxID=2950438 RepID=A0A9X3WR44_9BACI|nr:DeoR/GlpR family DNA-binding transcription regulator [Terrihalobacillus insolitus]MDC3411987.1 DeoR/GlpR family DNA-binding transcription regulator [Terrihalobacillus insolitus]MDC3423328.1 DeoR/GlpR family DNA-binding transcription regulator [Terrihalobacillus insolitus]